MAEKLKEGDIIARNLTKEFPAVSSAGVTKDEVQKMIDEALVGYQVKLTLVKNDESGDTNADLDEKGNLRIWDPHFEGDKLVKNYRIIDSTVEGVSDLDTDLTSAKYQNKFFQPKE